VRVGCRREIDRSFKTGGPAGETITFNCRITAEVGEDKTFVVATAIREPSPITKSKVQVKMKMTESKIEKHSNSGGNSDHWLVIEKKKVIHRNHFLRLFLLLFQLLWLTLDQLAQKILERNVM
jgi:hypothetical protein